MGIKQSIKSILMKFVPATIKYEFQKPFLLTNLSYSQEGEDLILNRIFADKINGFYVDVGAHHPFRFSNTYFFYQRGWRGINIDATPGSMHAFRENRPRDTNLELPISDKNDILTFYIFNEPALNSFSKELSVGRNGNRNNFIKEKVELKPIRLEVVLEQFLPPGEHIDFMSIDVEGLDLNVLKSNDWTRFRPSYIVVEDFNRGSLEEVCRIPISLYLKEVNYQPVSRAFNSIIFKDIKG